MRDPNDDKHVIISPSDLVLVMEEAAEVTKACAKILRFGVNDSHGTYHNGKPNVGVLIDEIGDLLHCIDRLDLPVEQIEEAKRAKEERLKIFGPEGSYLAEKNGESAP